MISMKYPVTVISSPIISRDLIRIETVHFISPLNVIYSPIISRDLIRIETQQQARARVRQPRPP